MRLHASHAPMQALADYIVSADPASYPQIFKESLDASCVDHLLRGLSTIVTVSASS